MQHQFVRLVDDLILVAMALLLSGVFCPLALVGSAQGCVAVGSGAGNPVQKCLSGNMASVPSSTLHHHSR